jgi:peptide deformylase
MAFLSIRTYPDPVLRVRCAEVESFDDELRKLAADMVETMHSAPGIGLAASQVGVELRLAVVDLSVGDDADQLQVLVNPEIISQEGEAEEVEGCLSMPGLSEKITRPERIRLRASNLDGDTFERWAEGLEARAICHEIDHLNGVLFIDRLTGLRREAAKRQLRRLSHTAEVATG